MNKSLIKTVSIILCCTLGVSSIGATVLASNKDKGSKISVSDASQVEPTRETAEISKDETVYVLAGADGSVKKIIVSDWIKNSIGSKSLTDVSELSDIQNVKGEETYTLNSDNMKVWDAEGNDIYYQGDIEKELPVGLTVSYTLDGQSITAEGLAGKSGKVTIRFDYDNRQYETVDIDGKQEKIYVPFVMLTGMLLDNDVFTNVEISNGKIINDGSRTIAAGIAFPGLQSNLNISKDKLEIPDWVEITADVKNFKLGMTVTVATNEVFNEIDTQRLDSIDKLTDSIDELNSAMNQLLDGSSQLYGGLCTLLDKSGDLTDGIDKLASGTKELKDATSKLDSGVSTLKEGMTTLATGLNTLASNNDALQSGAKQVFESLLSTANTQIAQAGLTVPTLTIDNYSDVLNGVITSLDENEVYSKALSAVTEAMEAQRPYIQSQVTSAVEAQVTSSVTEAVKAQVAANVTAAVREQVSEQVISSATGMSKSDYDNAVNAGLIDEATKAQVTAYIESQMSSQTVQDMIAANTDAQMQTQEVKNTVSSNVAAQMSSDTVKQTIAEQTELQVKKAISDNMAGEEVQAKLAAASEGAKSLIALKAQLDSYNTFYLGLITYTNGVSDAAAGAGELKNGTDALKDGTSKLNEGMSELYNGILQLKDGVPALTQGVSKLKDGSMRLSDGLKQFNEQGIRKLVDIADGDIAGLVTRIKATVDVSKSYKSFSGISDDMSGQVKFIYRTDAIEINE